MAILTLDTACIIYLADPEPSHIAAERVALERIVDAARERRDGTVLWLTTSYDRDLARLGDEGKRAERLAWLAAAPVSPTRSPGVFRIDVSVWDGDDTVASDEDAEMSERLRDLLIGPGRMQKALDEPERHAVRVFSDVDHLLAHWRSAAHAFVSTDKALVVDKRAALAALGITVLWPSAAAERYLS